MVLHRVAVGAVVARRAGAALRLDHPLAHCLLRRYARVGKASGGALFVGNFTEAHMSLPDHLRMPSARPTEHALL
jgi:hypothetical protein